MNFNPLVDTPGLCPDWVFHLSKGEYLLEETVLDNISEILCILDETETQVYGGKELFGKIYTKDEVKSGFEKLKQQISDCRTPAYMNKLWHNLKKEVE